MVSPVESMPSTRGKYAPLQVLKDSGKIFMNFIDCINESGN